MTPRPAADLSFVRLTDVSVDQIVAHMADPRVAEHMPLLTLAWTEDTVAKFIATKEACWHRDGLGHWAILSGGHYVGWGGFQKEGGDWDFGLVLTPDAFGLGPKITQKALAFARADARIPSVTFLLPPSRKKLAALKRLGASYVGAVPYGGSTFLKYRLDTAG